MLLKNIVGQYAVVYLHDSLADIPKTGYATNLAGRISKDGSGFVAIGTPTPVELLYPLSVPSGFYQFGLTAEETNADNIIITAIPVSTQYIVCPSMYQTDSGLRSDVNDIKDKTDDLNFVPMTNPAQIITDAGNQSLVDVDTFTSGLASLNDISVNDILTAVGVTTGGTWELKKVIKILTAWASGKWKLKSGTTNTQELLDPDDGTTVILEMSLSTASPYRIITVKI